MTKTEALKIRAQVEAGAAALPDQEASVEPSLTRTMQYDGKLIPAGTRVNWYGVLKRATVDLWDREDSNPDNAPTIWEDVLYRDGIRVIPAVIPAGGSFAMNEIGWWGDILKRSLLDNNVWTPEQNPSGWEDAE